MDKRFFILLWKQKVQLELNSNAELAESKYGRLLRTLD